MDLPGISKSDLLAWLLKNKENRTVCLSAGNQGKIFLCQQGELPLVIKTPLGTGILKPLYRWMLRHEYRVYHRLEGVEGIPKCYGLLEDRYLVLEYIKAKTLRGNEPNADGCFYRALFKLIQDIHARGVAHADLKRKDNILIDDKGKPHIIDFGAASMHHRGLRPINQYWFRLSKRFDLNAWVKHKYRRQYDRISAEDRQYLHYTLVERISRFIKKQYLKFSKSAD